MKQKRSKIVINLKTYFIDIFFSLNLLHLTNSDWYSHVKFDQSYKL